MRIADGSRECGPRIQKRLKKLEKLRFRDWKSWGFRALGNCSRLEEKFEEIRKSSKKFEEVRKSSKKFEKVRKNSKKIEEIRRNSKKIEEGRKSSKLVKGERF